MGGRTEINRSACAIAAGLGTAVLVLAGLPPREARSATVEDDITIAGSLDGLYPGKRTTIDVYITNPEPFDILVTEVDVDVDDAHSQCVDDWLIFFDLPEPVRVRANSTGAVPLPVELDFDTPMECRNAVWPLGFVAQLVEAPPEEHTGSTTTTSTPTASTSTSTTTPTSSTTTSSTSTSTTEPSPSPTTSTPTTAPPSSTTSTTEPSAGPSTTSTTAPSPATTSPSTSTPPTIAPPPPAPPAPPAAGHRGPLAFTGADIYPLVALGTFLTAAGVFLRRLAARRRRRA